MINFHPDMQQLDLFVAGNAEPSHALILSAHIDLCQQCRQKCQKLQKIQAIDALSESPRLNGDLSSMLHTITALPQLTEPLIKRSPNKTLELDGKEFIVPRSLRRYVQHTGNWSRLVGKLWQAPVDLGYMGKANFIYMEKGGKVPEHTHKGTELTLVIDGQYSDGISDYDCGDFTLLDGQHKHQPHSDVDGGCLVFTIVDKPLHFTSGIARLLNPFSHLFF